MNAKRGSGDAARWPAIAALLVAALLGTGCVRQLAVRGLASSLGDSAGVFASDDDPELVAQALPFALKMQEALLEADPENADLLLATCSGYTQYAFAFVELEAERLKLTDYRASRRQRERALGLYLRARGFCLRAFELELPEARERLVRDPEAAAAELGEKHVALLYWTAGSWGSAISAGVDRTELVVDLPVVRALLERCLELDADWGDGAVHEAMMVLAALPEAMGGSYEQAAERYRKALAASGGRRAGTHVTWAWLVAVPRQDRADFEAKLELALAIDPNAGRDEDRLANVVQQDFARFLLDQADELFLDDL